MENNIQEPKPSIEVNLANIDAFTVWKLLDTGFQANCIAVSAPPCIFANVLDLVHHKMHQPTEYLERGETVKSMLRSINQTLILCCPLPSCCQAVTQQEIVASLEAGCWN